MRCSTTHRLHCSLFFVQTCDDDVHRRVELIYTVWDDAAANLASIRHLGCIRIKWGTSQARLHCTVFLVLSLINNAVM